MLRSSMCGELASPWSLKSIWSFQLYFSVSACSSAESGRVDPSLGGTGTHEHGPQYLCSCWTRGGHHRHRWIQWHRPDSRGGALLPGHKQLDRPGAAQRAAQCNGRRRCLEPLDCQEVLLLRAGPTMIDIIETCSTRGQYGSSTEAGGLKPSQLSLHSRLWVTHRTSLLWRGQRFSVDIFPTVMARKDHPKTKCRYPTWTWEWILRASWLSRLVHILFFHVRLFMLFHFSFLWKLCLCVEKTLLTLTNAA